MPTLFCEGEVRPEPLGGECFVSPAASKLRSEGVEIRIVDVVENRAADPTPHAMLYHFNVGYPALSTGSVVRLGDAVLAGPLMIPEEAASPHSFSVPVAESPAAVCSLATPTKAGSFVLTIGQSAATLPHLQILAGPTTARLRARHRTVHGRPRTGRAERRRADPRSLGAPPIPPARRLRRDARLDRRTVVKERGGRAGAVAAGWPDRVRRKLIALWRAIRAGNRYEPSRYYMRGSGPKSRSANAPKKR